ncbi:PH domain containing protein [Cryptosporidium hominis]|uniref:PH domain containing protein n=1 Tax=Cryptosporidium hominis TaxID=237895 RepID=A0ABX5BIF3_CRYHO|nr:PH domain containing protein [Cryptosporidium hominis]|eukprot:PPS97836.1 PH domain containing protein [Cryptosporidium hominis]
MSINPELFNLRETGELIPSLLRDEYMLMSRKSVKFGLDDVNERFKGHGDVFVTNKRVILIRSKLSTNALSNFVSLCIPLKNVYDLEFKQPVLLASYLEGFVKPCNNSTYPLSGNSKWWISFHKGGCATFVRSFYKIYLKATKDSITEEDLEDEYDRRNSSNIAYIDKTDPTVIYIQE